MLLLGAAAGRGHSCTRPFGIVRVSPPTTMAAWLARDLPETTPRFATRAYVSPRGLSRSTCGTVVERMVRRKSARGPHGHGMQGDRGSNPLSSTPGQWPSPSSTARETRRSRSRYAATASARPMRSSRAAVTRATIAGLFPCRPDPSGRRRLRGRGGRPRDPSTHRRRLTAPDTGSVLLARASQWRQHVDPTQSTDPYALEGGYPTPETIQKADDDADLNRGAQDAR